MEAFEKPVLSLGLLLRGPQPAPVIHDAAQNPAYRTDKNNENRPDRQWLDGAGNSISRRFAVIEVASIVRGTDEKIRVVRDFRMLRDVCRQRGIRCQIGRV